MAAGCIKPHGYEDICVGRFKTLSLKYHENVVQKIDGTLGSKFCHLSQSECFPLQAIEIQSGLNNKEMQYLHKRKSRNIESIAQSEAE